MASMLRPAAFRSHVLSLAKSCSIGFRSGEYFGRKKSLAPAARMAARIALPLWGAEIVHDDDVARLQRRHQDLFDIEPEALAVDRPVQEPRCDDAVVAQRCQDGQGPPVTVRPLAMQPLADRCPAAQPGHVGLGPVRRAIDSLDRLLFRLTIDEDQARRIDPMAILQPLPAPARDVGATLLGGEQRLFL